jgi:uncharacterized UPF0160 family protein
LSGEILFTIYPDKKNSGWIVQTVSAKDISFGFRKGLKEEYRGIMDKKKLEEIAEIKGITFVHNQGFIGGASTR